MQLPPPPVLASIVIVIFLAIGIHEYAHAKFADLAGDPTPRLFGRVTLNLTRHFDPMGTIMIIFTSIVGYGIGWGKPVPMDPRKMRNPRWDHFVAVAAGPISNFIQAALYASLLRVGRQAGWFTDIDILLSLVRDPNMQTPSFLPALLTTGVVINLSLMLFNLIPLGPLDGHWLLGTFMSEPVRARWYIWNRQVGSMLLFALVLIGQISGGGLLGKIIGPPLLATFDFLTGLNISG